MAKTGRILFFLIIYFLASLQVFGDDLEHLAVFSDPAQIWGDGIERTIEEAYRACFKTKIIGSRIMNLRLPFSENNERNILSDLSWELIAGGKGSPSELWPVIDEILGLDDFEYYVKTLSENYEQVIIFDMPGKSWKSSRNIYDIARMKNGAYQGLPHRPHVYKHGKGIDEADVYNYLYCIGYTGIDCSGFVWYVLSYIAEQNGFDLGRALHRSMGIPRGSDPAWYAGTSFFGSQNRQLMMVPDRIKNLRPADIILFRGPRGVMSHSAIIQSIDFEKGIIRYLQSTDEAPLLERGVHESFIYFDPEKTDISLSDTELKWTQQRQAPFPGEKPSPFSDDGKRYRAYPESGGGRVVRLRLLQN